MDLTNRTFLRSLYTSFRFFMTSRIFIQTGILKAQCTRDLFAWKYPKGVQPIRGNHPGLIPISEKLTKKQQRNMNMLESDWNGIEALLSAANSFSRNVNDTELVMT